ncbi:MAG: ankyrin repeat domain-containing protein [Acidobacteriota bacterium]
MRSKLLIRSAAAVLLTAASCWAATDASLIDAIKRRDIKAADALIAKHANLDAVLPDGATALAWAVFLDLQNTALKLIDAGANVNTAGDYGETPLTLALANGNATLSARLLKGGADPKATRWNGETTLLIASGAGSVAEVKLLLEVGLDVNATEPEKGQNALMWAAAEGHPDVVDLLIQKGANVNAASKSGFTPVVFATMKNDRASVQRLIQAGADPNYALPDKDKTEALIVAGAYSSDEAALALLDGGANPNVTDRKGQTPLHVAAQAGSLELVRKLVSKGANLNARTEKTKGMPGGYFRGLGGEQTPLLLAAKFNRVDVMRALIEAGADTKLKAQDGTTLFLAAAGSGHVEAAKYAYEFDKDPKAVDNLGFTAMHESVSGTGRLATQPELTELVQYLADIGVPLDEVDSRGRTPIQVGDGAPLDQPIQRMADIIIDRGGKPRYFPKEYVKPAKASASE